MWYMSSPVTVSIDVPQAREDVYAFLDVMANHESFTDHLLTNWRVSGPPTAVRAKAAVTVKSGGMSDEATFEVIEVEDGRMIKERNWASKGRRVATATYVLSALPVAGTPLECPFACEQVPGSEAPLVPLMRRMARRGNEGSMTRLAEQLAM